MVSIEAAGASSPMEMEMPGVVKHGRNGTKKYDRNKTDCARYANEGRAEKSKARKLAKHLTRCPWDKVARKAFEALPLLIIGKISVPAHMLSPSALRAAQGLTLSAAKRGTAPLQVSA